MWALHRAWARKLVHRLAGTVKEADAIRIQGYRDQLLAEASDLERQAAALRARMRSRAELEVSRGGLDRASATGG